MQDDFTGKIVNIVDGDTYDILFDLAFGVKITKRCRLYGADTFETSGPNATLGKSAKRFCIDQFLNKKCFITSHGKCSFGRILVSVKIDGINIVEQLRKQGFLNE